ncbi:MAG TPA: RDD family protein [Streptosporangiaceae bacterium]|nr:RDD family protein [Streptosporangiaceae bacterium]
MASKSRKRGGAAPARSAGTTRAGTTRAGTARARTVPAGTARARTVPAGTVPAGTAQAGSAQAGSAQLTAPPEVRENPKTEAYPGQQFGLPERGAGSVASIGSRIVALFIDWLLSLAIAHWLTHSQYWTILIFAVEVFVLTALTGSTVGMRICRIRVIRTGGGPVGFRWALVRTVLLLTVVLPLITDFDRRGIHDRAADTIVVRS